MTNIHMQSTLGSPYNRDAYMGLLHKQFNVDQFRNPIELEGNGIRSLEQLGLIHISDEKRLPIFEARINPETQLHRNRVGLRNIIAKQIKQREEEGALAVYLNERYEDQWRLSLIAIEHHFDEGGNLTTNETDSRRYTYLLGKDAKIRTAAEQLTKLDKESSLEDFKNAFSVETLNKEFYTKLHKWYDNAKSKVFFPNDEKKVEDEEHIALSLIRLLTRLLFVWFIKEKNMVDNDLFDPSKLQEIVCWNKPSSFYKAVLQNLFFATLNCPIQDRAFRTINGHSNGINDSLGSNLYQYQDYFQGNPDSVIDLFAKTPFLNGGLFECLDRERQEQRENRNGSASIDKTIRLDCFSNSGDNPINVPNELFFNDDRNQPGLIDLLSQYQFTVEESTPLDIEVALDPELMGQIFENLLADYNPETQRNARKNTGSYYTPRHIVDYMVTESLKLHLEQALRGKNGSRGTEGKLRKLFNGTNEFDSKQTETLIKSIDGLRILDPAVGSGAFPMGILQRLVGLLEVLDPQNQQFKQRQFDKAKEIEDADIRQRTLDDIEDAFSEENDYNNYARKLYLIKNIVFGVDIQPIAIHIAKLRFFISLAIEQSVNKRSKRGNYGVRALPNMEIKFVSADSLIPLSGVSSKQLAFGDDNLAELKEQLFRIRSDYFHATRENQKKQCRHKDKLIRQEIEQELIRNDLYSGKEKESDVRNSAEKVRSWDPYNQTSTAEWFNSEYIFGIRDGFDLVIGNPPYIQLQKDSGALAKKYRDYKFKTFASTADIYCLFYEQSYRLLKQNGICSLITSNKWMRTKYGEKLRDYLVAQVKPLALLDLGPGVFRNATVDTNIFFYQKSETNDIDTLACDTVKNRQIKPISELDLMPIPKKGKPWVILSRIEQGIIDKINKIGTPLKEWDISIYYGIKTGCNEAFIIDNETKEKLIEEDPKSVELLKPVLRGREIERYKHSWDKTKLWLIATFPSLKLDIDHYPAIKKHLLSFGKERLEQGGKTLPDGTKSRKKTIYAWYELQDTCAYHAEFEKEKIVWARLMRVHKKETRYPRFGYVEPEKYVIDSCCLITGEKWIPYVLAILNSRFSEYIINKKVAVLDSGGFQVRQQYVEDMLIPSINSHNICLLTRIENLVHKIICTKQSNPSSDTNRYEIQIDQLVYDLYELTPEEINTIEKCLN